MQRFVFGNPSIIYGCGKIIYHALYIFVSLYIHFYKDFFEYVVFSIFLFASPWHFNFGDELQDVDFLFFNLFQHIHQK